MAGRSPSPLRKVFYNLTVTGLSVAVALFVGTIELLSLGADRLPTPHGGVLNALMRMDAQSMGYGVAALFALSWLVSVSVWKIGRFEERT